MLTFGETPDDEPADRQDLIMHAWLQVGDQAIMGCDSPPEFRRETGGFSVAIHTGDRAEAERIFAALAQGGTVSMPFEETFWSPGFGMLTDRFGTPWLVNTEAEGGADAGG
jgi:PhnB protein